MAYIGEMNVSVKGGSGGNKYMLMAPWEEYREQARSKNKEAINSQRRHTVYKAISRLNCTTGL